MGREQAVESGIAGDIFHLSFKITFPISISFFLAIFSFPATVTSPLQLP